MAQRFLFSTEVSSYTVNKYTTLSLFVRKNRTLLKWMKQLCINTADEDGIVTNDTFVPAEPIPTPAVKIII